jgi:predicted ATPase
MLIAVSGAQGVGKTTLLNEIAMLDYTVDPFKVSRTVQKEMGFATLKEAVSSFERVKNLHENIIQRKFDHDVKLVHKCKHDVVFVERSFYDILTYAEVYALQFHEIKSTVEEWLDGFRHACLNFQKQVYSGLILIEPNAKLVFEHDHERGEEEMQRLVDSRLKELCSYSSLPIKYIVDLNIKDRVSQVVRFVGKL